MTALKNAAICGERNRLACDEGIYTQSGAFIPLLCPEEAEFRIGDIAWSLAHQCRFTGHTRAFYSIAQHSVIASEMIAPEFAYDALMHDACEAYLGDVSAPLKRLLPDYKEIERRFEEALFAHFGVRFPLPPEVKEMDMRMLATERRDMVPLAGQFHALDGVKPLPIKIKPWGFWDAEQAFLAKYRELRIQGL